ncbi:hypothetical protein J6590_087700 [Homalodisca vitripennis]|nr:hypothetical protein J6590_087700 [Homalodisca vitripennis]
MTTLTDKSLLDLFLEVTFQLQLLEEIGFHRTPARQQKNLKLVGNPSGFQGEQREDLLAIYIRVAHDSSQLSVKSFNHDIGAREIVALAMMLASKQHPKYTTPPAALQTSLMSHAKTLAYSSFHSRHVILLKKKWTDRLET